MNKNIYIYIYISLCLKMRDFTLQMGDGDA